MGMALHEAVAFSVRGTFQMPKEAVAYPVDAYCGMYVVL
jgi:hypothetical protein